MLYIYIKPPYNVNTSKNKTYIYKTEIKTLQQKSAEEKYTI